MEKLRYTDAEIEAIKNVFKKYKFVCKAEENKHIISVYTADAWGNFVKWFYFCGYTNENKRYFRCYKKTQIWISETRPDLTENDCVSMFEELYDLLNCHDQNFMNVVINHDDWCVIIHKSKEKGERICDGQYNESWLNWDWKYRIGKYKLTEDMYYIFQLIERELLIRSKKIEDSFENKGYYTHFDNLKDNLRYSKKLIIPKHSISLLLLIKQNLIRFDGEKYIVNKI